MTYVSWGVLYEGPTDQVYFDVLIPRLMEDIVLSSGIRTSTIPSAPAVVLTRGTIEQVVKEACEARDAFHLCFIHSDTGGRNLEGMLEHRSTAYCERMHALCNWPPVRCIVIAPRKETEAWILADGSAVTSALGYSDTPTSIGLPATAAQAERVADPKATLKQAMQRVRGRRRPVSESDLFPAIAQRQSFSELRRTRSFRQFEQKLILGMADLGCVAWPQTGAQSGGGV
jgi:Domain of unknown function (DUF4276)